MTRSWVTAARRLTAFAVVLLLLATLGRLLESQWWIFHLLVHFPLHIALLLVVLLALAVILRMPIVAILAGLCLVTQAPALVWSYGDGAAAAGTSIERSLVVTTFNMNGGRVDEAKFLDYLDSKDPDILLVQESYSIPKPLLRQLVQRYPQYGPGRKLRRHSRMIFSRFPIVAAKRIRVARRVSFLVFLVELGDRVATVITLHAPNPTSRPGFEMRNHLFVAMATRMPSYHRPIIVAGDFNSTPWSGYFERLTSGTGLRNASEGRGWVATWPARLGGLGIGIDHILVSDDIEVAWIAPGPDIGSDHRPLTAWLELKR